MFDDIRSDDGLGLDGQRRVRHLDGDRPLADREVPLGQQGERRISAAVQAWLDGELPEAAVRKGDTAKDVEFWNRLNGEAERRRQMRTPAHLVANIMAALPHTAPQVITPWYRREFVLTPRAALIAGGAIVGVTAAATAAVVYLMR